jgi:hypothetical protein
MKIQTERKRAGVVLIEVVLVLTLLELTGVAFATFSSAERQCEQNPTVEARDGGCIKEVGTPDGRP